jgi:hypothetical protein
MLKSNAAINVVNFLYFCQTNSKPLIGLNLVPTQRAKLIVRSPVNFWQLIFGNIICRINQELLTKGHTPHF